MSSSWVMWASLMTDSEITSTDAGMSWMLSLRLRAVTTISSVWFSRALASGVAAAGAGAAAGWLVTEGVALSWARAAGLPKPNAAPTRSVTAPPRSLGPRSAPTAAIRLRTSRILPPRRSFFERLRPTSIGSMRTSLPASAEQLRRMPPQEFPPRHTHPRCGGRQCSRLHEVNPKKRSARHDVRLRRPGFLNGHAARTANNLQAVAYSLRNSMLSRNCDVAARLRPRTRPPSARCGMQPAGTPGKTVSAFLARAAGGCGGGSAHHQLGREGYAHGLGVGCREALQQQLRGLAAHLAVLDAHGGQRRIHHVDQGNVVVTDDGHVLRAAQPERRQAVVAAQRDQVVRRHDGRDGAVAFEQFGARDAARPAREFGRLHHVAVRDTVALRRQLDTLRVREAGGKVVGPRHVADLAVAQAHQVVDGHLHRIEVVVHDLRREPVILGTVYQHDGDVLEDAAAHDLVVPAGGGHHQPVDLALEHLLEHALAVGRAARGIGNQRRVALGRQALLDPPDDGREDRVLDVRQQDADDMRAPAGQRGRQLVRAIAHRPRRLNDPHHRLVADEVARLRIERARDRGDIDVRMRRDVADRHPRGWLRARWPFHCTDIVATRSSWRRKRCASPGTRSIVDSSLRPT